MVTVTSAELQKNFGQYREQALREPVSVTHHGRESLVVMAADEFKRLKALDTRQVLFVSELPEDMKTALASSTPSPEAAEFNNEFKP